MKRIISAILAIAMLCSITAGLNLTAHAGELSGTCGTNVTWEIDAETGVLTISGEGAINDYSTSDTATSPFYYNDNVKTAVIEEGITEIGSHAFFYCTTLTNVTLPSTLEVIGDGAFRYATNLREIIIPEGVKVIENNAFQNCEKMTKAVIPSTVETMSYQIFWNCTSLTDVTLGSGITTISESIFDNCSALSEITIPESVTEIKGYAFEDCKMLASIELPKNIQSIGNYAFRNCDALTEITIPESIKSIGSYAFAECDNLYTVVLPDNLSYINSYMFYKCSRLTNINMPSALTEIYNHAFENCDFLQEIVLPEGLTYLGSNAFYSCNWLDKVVLPSTLTSITDLAFGELTQSDDLYIPASITKIGNYAFSTTYFENTYYGGTADQWAKISFGTPDSNPLYKGDNLYFNNEPATDVVLTEETTSIGPYTFNTYYQTNIETISIYNPECEIYDSQNTFHPSVTICGYTGSTAEAYATKYGRSFIPLDSSIITVVEPDLGEITGLEYGDNRVIWDEEFTLKATAFDGAKFEGWKVNGRLVSLNNIYTDVCKNNMTIEAVFSETDNDETITVTFLDKWGNVVATYNGTVDEIQAQLANAIPSASDIVGYTFNGWNMTDEQIKAITTSTTVWAQYKKAQVGYTVTCNAQISLPNGVVNGNIPYDTKVTVFDENATAWKIGDSIVAYGNSYSFYVGANVTVEAVYEAVTATPTVTMLKISNHSQKQFQFLATRSLPEGYRLVNAGFVFGRDMSDDELTLSNVGKINDGGYMIKVGYCSIYGSNQFALNYGVSGGYACAKAFVTYRNLADNSIHTIYSDFFKA